MLTQLALHHHRWTNVHGKQEKKHKKWQTQIRLSVIPSPSSESGYRYAKATHPFGIKRITHQWLPCLRSYVLGRNFLWSTGESDSCHTEIQG